MPQSPTGSDVLIIGCGLAGLTLALSLPSRLRITVLSKAVPTNAPVPGRKAALPPCWTPPTACSPMCRTR